MWKVKINQSKEKEKIDVDPSMALKIRVIKQGFYQL